MADADLNPTWQAWLDEQNKQRTEQTLTANPWLGNNSDGTPKLLTSEDKDGYQTQYMNVYGNLANNQRDVAAIESFELEDPNSQASNNLYYGGSAGAANNLANSQFQKATAAGRRGIDGYDTSQMDQSRAMGQSLGNSLNAQANGNPLSVSQQQLSSNFNNSRNGLSSIVNSTRGGPLSNVAARDAASYQNATSQQAQAIQSNDLMNQERMNSYGQLSTLGNQMRGNDITRATNESKLGLKNQGINDQETIRRQNLGFGIAANGMQGAQNRNNSRSAWLTTSLGGITDQQRQQAALENQNSKALLDATSGGLGAAAQIAKTYDNGDDDEGN